MPVLFVLNMASKNPDLDNLRARAADLERRVGRKISRIKSKNGALVAGTTLDPRRDKGKAQTLRTRDAAAYVRQLESFINPKTQFEAGVRGAPLPRTKWLKYEQGAQKVRDKADAKIVPFANERLPGPPSATETVGQRQDKLRTKHPTATNMAYRPPVLKPFNVKDLDSLTKLTKANAKRMTKKWDKAEHARAQKELQQIVAVFRDEGIKNDVATLSYGQFDMLWNLTSFADKASLAYHQISSKYDAEQEIPQEVLDTQLSQAKALIDWVKRFKI